MTMIKHTCLWHYDKCHVSTWHTSCSMWLFYSVPIITINYHDKKHKANDDNIEAAVADEEELNDIKPIPNRTASISSGVGDHIGGPSSQQRSKTTTSTSTTHHSSTTKHPIQTIEVVDKGKSSSPTHGRQQRASSGTVQIHPSEHQSPRHSHLSHTTTTTSATTTTTTTSAANNTTSSSTDQRNQQQRQDREDGEGGEGSSSGHLVTVKISKLW